ncbi:FUSC family protein [Ralstonia soli]|uniref:FUSC family protein n=1 Tax=Ralstonia soli TaxID=2953896 RepID=A0ABT1AE61_9RALS|nr:FUSC family protein [Ralstonia soli]MCO5396668.1 FUSC family protein [Ralstonia soli]
MNPTSFAGRLWSLNGAVSDLAAEVAHDPGRVRLFNAVRAVVASLVAAVTLYQFAIRSGHSIELVAPGVLISFLWVLLARETTFRRQVEMLLASSTAIAVTTFVIPHLNGYPSWCGAIYLCLGMFFGTLVQDCARRAFGITIMWFVVTCVELYLSPSLATMPFQIASVAIGAGVTFTICILFLPHLRTRVLRSALSDFQWNANFIRRSALDQPSQANARRKAKLRALERLGRSIAVIESELSGHNSAQSDSFFHALSRAHAVCCYLVNIESKIAIETLHSSVPESGQSTKLNDRLSTRIAVLNESLSTLRTIAGKMEIRSIVLSPKSPLSIDSLAWRPAIQVTAAITTALLLAELLLPSRWYWAVVTANAVLARSNTSTFHKSFLRLVGTVTGLAIGLLAGWLIGGNLVLAYATIFAVIFALHFCLPANYGIGIFFATIFVGLLYASLGFSEIQILFTRLEETTIGVLAALLVATAVFPARAISEASSAERAVLIALKGVVDTLAAGATQRLSDTYQRFRTLDRRMSEAKLALRPVMTLERLIDKHATHERWCHLEECRSWLKIVLHDLDLNSSKSLTTMVDLQPLAVMLEGMVGGEYVLTDERKQVFIQHDTEEDAAIKATTALNRYWAAKHR